MREENIRLIVPTPIQPTYQSAQRSGLMSVADFMALVAARQTA
jgi:hypothetical protein